MRLAIAQKDDGRFPVELLDRRMVGDICDGGLFPPYDQRTPATFAACRARREREARESAEIEAAIAESLELERNPEALIARCAATPEVGRGKGLAMACESVQQERDEMAAARLVEDGPALAAACEATPEVDWKGPLFYGCMSYSTALESALADAIAGDDQAWAILCPGGGEAEVADRDRHVSSACGLAGKLREDREIEALLADPAKIDAQCGAAPRDQLPPILFGACLERDSRRRDARIERLAGDEAAFARDCGRFGRKLAGSPGSGGDDDEQLCRNAYNLRENRKARAAAEAKGLVCWADVIYSPDRPTCVSRAEYDSERPRALTDADSPVREGSSLDRAARARAAAILAGARADRAYPKGRPDDRW